MLHAAIKNLGICDFILIQEYLSNRVDLLYEDFFHYRTGSCVSIIRVTKNKLRSHSTFMSSLEISTAVEFQGLLNYEDLLNINESGEKFNTSLTT